MPRHESASDPSHPGNNEPSDSGPESEGSSSEHPSYTPVQIGPYVLRETLGEAGMGVIEQTQDPGIRNHAS